MRINITREMLVEKKACKDALKIFDDRHPDGKWVVTDWQKENTERLFNEFPRYARWLVAYGFIPAHGIDVTRETCKCE